METQKNKLGAVGLILGIVGIILSFAVVGGVIGIIGFVLSIVALAKKGAKKGAAIAGFVLNLLAIIIMIAIVAAGASILSSGGEIKNDAQIENDSFSNQLEGSSENENKSEKEASKNEEVNETVENYEEQTAFGVGETADYDDVKVTLIGVTESSGDEINKPSEGNVFVLAEFEIENNSDKELNISSMMSFDAYQDGYSTSLSLGALMENDGESLDGSIASGKKMKGSVGYEIPASYSELEISVQLDVWSKQKISFVYSK